MNLEALFSQAAQSKTTMPCCPRHIHQSEGPHLKIYLSTCVTLCSHSPIYFHVIVFEWTVTVLLTNETFCLGARKSITNQPTHNFLHRIHCCLGGGGDDPAELNWTQRGHLLLQSLWKFLCISLLSSFQTSTKPDRAAGAGCQTSLPQ